MLYYMVKESADNKTRLGGFLVKNELYTAKEKEKFCISDSLVLPVKVSKKDVYIFFGVRFCSAEAFFRYKTKAQKERLNSVYCDIKALAERGIVHDVLKTQHNMSTVMYLYNELVKTEKANFIQKDIADFFTLYGFSVKEDGCIGYTVTI